ncbi:MAG: hypothetical protein EX269_00415 [Acidimicrobiales bacterium]|nr:MAG: hypothetical protein EX269_00415 [Acidimicrobiales bacterium]
MEHTNGGTVMSEATLAYEAYVRCTEAAAWDAIVNGDRTARYFYGTRVDSDWVPGAAVRYLSADGDVVADGEVLAVAEPNRVEMTFLPHWSPELNAEGPTRMAWLVDTKAGATRIRVEYYGLMSDSLTFADFQAGIPFIVSGMKTVLETGSSLNQ